VTVCCYIHTCHHPIRITVPALHSRHKWTNAPSVKRLVVDEEIMKPDHWLGSVLLSFLQCFDNFCWVPIKNVCNLSQDKLIKLDSMRWFSHQHRTGGLHNCITYLLMDVVAWPTATPTSISFLHNDSADHHILEGSRSWVYDPQIQTLVRFVYNAPNCQVSSSYIKSFGSYRVDKQTHAAENIHLAPLCYAGG